jgi:menaquinone-dependent protoporphyrinogen oxidase
MSDILVAFATKAGATEEVAAAIADALRKSGNVVDLRRARDVGEPVSRWGCIVLGAPIYSGRWHRDAHRFLRRHRGELERVPVAIFGMGPRSPEEEVW